jgi:hypothetical protein
MFLRPHKSSPVPESSPAVQAGDAAARRLQTLLEWRDDAKRVGRAYAAWCAADRHDRQRLYVSFLDALTREERAAHKLERVISTLGTADAVA